MPVIRNAHWFVSKVTAGDVVFKGEETSSRPGAGKLQHFPPPYFRPRSHTVQYYLVTSMQYSEYT